MANFKHPHWTTIDNIGKGRGRWSEDLARDTIVKIKREFEALKLRFDLGDRDPETLIGLYDVISAFAMVWIPLTADLYEYTGGDKGYYRGSGAGDPRYWVLDRDKRQVMDAIEAMGADFDKMLIESGRYTKKDFADALKLPEDEPLTFHQWKRPKVSHWRQLSIPKEKHYDLEVRKALH